MARIAGLTPHAPPRLRDTLGEFAVVLDLARHALLKSPKPKKVRVREAVLVVPGFGTNDSATALLRQHLRDAGFRVFSWRQGINRGPGGSVMRRLSQRVKSLAQRTRRPVHIVGWSLGGLMARVIAGRLPQLVGRVIAMGSPLTADPAASRLSTVYGWVAHSPLSARTARKMLSESAKAPVVSIYSRNDGVVSWQASADAPGECVRREVESTHLGLMVDAKVHDVVARELAKPLA